MPRRHILSGGGKDTSLAIFWDRDTPNVLCCTITHRLNQVTHSGLASSELSS